jgi:class 3 adenylate cyclase/Tfp pilus assembly protein PilF
MSAILNLRLVAVIVVAASLRIASGQAVNIPPPPDRASLPDSIYFNDRYDWIWDNFLFTRPDTAFVLSEAMYREALGPGQEVWAAKALDLQGITWYVRGQPLKAAEYSTRTLPIYEALNDRQTLASTLGNTGAFLMRGSLYDSALVVLGRALRIQAELHDTVGMANTHNSMGNVHLERGDLHRALDAYRSALKNAEAVTDSAAIANAEGNLGTVYAKQKEFAKALHHFERSRDVLRHLNEQNNLVVALTNIGGAYSELNDTTRALASLREALALSERSGDMRNMAVARINIGELYGKAGDHERAYVTFEAGLRNTEESQDPWVRSQLLMNIGASSFELGRFKEAARLGEEALALARREGIITPMRDAAELLAKVYRKEGRFEQALEAQLLFTQLRDSLMNEENQRAVIGFDLRRNYERQALTDSLQHASETALQVNEIQKQKVIRNGFVGGFALVALFAVVFFNQRNRISKEKARSEELLLNILPEEVAEELKAKGEAEAVQIDQVTVLFTDFKGFTSLSENLTPRELVRDLNECFSAFDRITEKYSIEKIKTIGDAYMAAGGLPATNTTHAVDTIKAALEMRDFIEVGKQRKIAAGLPYFEIRIGVHTGPVVAGIVGVKKFQYDIWGDTVNTASRMESSGEVGKVNISEATYRLVNGEGRSVNGNYPTCSPFTNSHSPDLVFTARGRVQAKGKGEMEMYFVERSV